MIRASSYITAFLAALALVVSILEAHADNRVALIIGNAAYQNAPALTNTGNDAEDVAVALKRVGFNVFFERNLTKRGMERALAGFARAARDADAALFYYAGHGMQYRGLNYLLPVDAKLEDEFSLDFEMTRLDDVLASLGRSRGIRILILDACRNNPLVEKLAGKATTRDFVAARGLARLDAARGMVVAYSTQADKVAEDGTGRNSPFTGALVKQIDEPGLEIGALFRRVAADVNRVTGGRQFPELSISLLGEFFFNPADTDIQAWSKVRGTQDPAELRKFLDLYPSSPLVTDVRERLEAIERAARERLAREKSDREQAERERIAREQAAAPRLEDQAKAEEERIRLGREQAAQSVPAPAPADSQTAILTVPPIPPTTAPTPSTVTGPNKYDGAWEAKESCTASPNFPPFITSFDITVRNGVASGTRLIERRHGIVTFRGVIRSGTASFHATGKFPDGNSPEWYIEYHGNVKSSDQVSYKGEMRRRSDDRKLRDCVLALSRIEQAAQPAPAPAPADPQTAILTVPPIPPTTAPPPLTGGALVQEIKKELKRVGCYGGRLDDKWTTADTKSSIQRFVKYAKLPSTPDEPVLEFLEALRSESERICPIVCTTRQLEVDGRCVTKTCPSGSYLDEEGNCTPKRQKEVARPEPEPSTSKRRSTTSSSRPAERNDTENSPSGAAIRRADRAREVGAYQRCMGARSGCYERTIAKGKTPEQARAWCGRPVTC